MQLVLDIVPAVPSLANFVAGRNAEAFEAVRALAERADGRGIYLWGAPGSGRSHLLKGFAAQTGGVYLKGSIGDGSGSAWAVDDVEALEDDGQLALFNLVNRARAGAGALLMAGADAPARLRVRPDLAARLAWGLVFQLQPLTDAEKEGALAAHARTRGFDLAPEVARYLLTHAPRDLPSLMSLLDALDRHSLVTHRAITVPLVRELLLPV